MLFSADATVYPANVSKPGVVWSLADSADSAYVTLNSDSVKAKKVTENHYVTINAVSQDGKASDSITILVMSEGEQNLIIKSGERYLTGRTQAVDPSGKATLDLHNDELLDNPYLYVRFYLSGDNGICYAQPMVLNVEGEEFAPVDVPETHDISTFLRALVTVVDQFFFKFNPLIWIFKYFGLGYNPIERL